MSRDQFIEDVGLHYSRLGLSRTASRAIGALLVSDDPLDAPTLASALSVAKSSLSVALRQLEQLGLVERTRAPRAPRDQYRVVPNMFEAAFESKLQELTAFRNLAAEGLAVLAPDSAAYHRLARLAELYEFMAAETAQSLARWRARPDADSSTPAV